MADEDQAHATVAHQFVHDAQDLVPDRDVEGRCGLVGDQDFGVGGQHHGDHDALAHAARNLVRIGVEDPLGVADLNGAEHFKRLVARGLRGGAGVQAVALGDLAPDGHDRVEAEFRVLHDHADARAAQGPHLAFGQVQDRLAVKLHPVRRHPSRRAHKTKNGASRSSTYQSRTRPRPPAFRGQDQS